MKQNLSRPNFLLLLPLLLALLLALQMGSSAAAQPADTAATVQWTDGFETYDACGEGAAVCDVTQPVSNTDLYFPEPPWEHSGLPDAFVLADTPANVHSGSNVLRMHGVTNSIYGSLAYRALGNGATVYPPYEITFFVKSADPDDPNFPITSGSLQKTAGVELSTSPDVTGSHRGLLAFTAIPLGDGNYQQQIVGGVFEEPLSEGVYLQDWTAGRWYKITVRYEPVLADPTVVKISYFVDDIKKGEQTRPVSYYENSLDYVGLWAGAGTVWYDDVVVEASTDVFNFDTPDAPEPALFLPLVIRE